MKRKLWIGVAIIGVVALLLWANLRRLEGAMTSAGQQGAVQGPSGAPIVKVESVRKRSLVQEVLAPGTVEAGVVQELRAPFTTKQVRLKVGIGDRVEANQILAELASEELTAQVLAQEAQVARAEANLVSLRQQQAQAPIQLAQRLEQARAQLLQAEEGLVAASRQSQQLKRRLEQARAQVELLQSRSAGGSAQVEQARQALMEAEAAYRADPLQPSLREAYEKARAAYEAALQQSQEQARQTAAELRRAYDELEAAEQEYSQSGGENPTAVQLARSQVEAARLAVRLAEQEAQSGGNIAQQVRAAEAELAAARASLTALQAKLEKATLRAPAAGTVLQVGIQDGQPAQEGQLLIALGDLDQMKVTARVDEVDIGKVKVGQVLSVKPSAYPNRLFDGQVTRVAAQRAQAAPGASTSGSYFEVEGRVTNQGGLLRGGMNAEVTIRTEQRDSAIVVGLAAVREDGDFASVLVVENFKVVVRPVKLGLRTQTEVEILEGLKEGDLVIVSPFTLINSLKEGDPVRIERVEGEKAP